jgi:hypothetical protein
MAPTSRNQAFRAGFTIEDAFVNRKNDAFPPSTPCLQHPGDWFDPRRRTLTTRQCLSCPSLAGCAAAALHHRPSHGMWAGVWIDGDFADKQRLLTLTATSLTPSASPKPAAPQPLSPTPPRSPARPRPGHRHRVGTLAMAAAGPAVAALITARSAGHCEVMAPGCTYQQCAIFSRRRRAHRSPLGSPADAIASCHNCVDLIEHTDLPTALDLGYVVDPRNCTSTTAMLWRQHRWSYLDTRGQRRPADGPALAHTA